MDEIRNEQGEVKLVDSICLMPPLRKTKGLYLLSIGPYRLLSEAGSGIDLGGIGKGFAQTASQITLRRNCLGLLHSGGSTVLALDA